jgi:hypothetical protein
MFQSGTENISCRTKFSNYLASELISVELNTLEMTVVPFNLGFLEQTTATRETTTLHMKRIRVCLPPDAPEFQVSLQRVYAPDNRPVSLVMIQCNKDDSDLLLKMLMMKKHREKFIFMPWFVYHTTEQHLKQTIMNDHRLWNITFKSIVVTGFKDNNDKIKMGTNTYIKNQGMEEPTIEDMSVTEYLRNLKHPVTRHNMFDCVYPSIDGKREFIITRTNSGDTETYLRNVRGELARQMGPESLQHEFTGVAEVLREAEGDVWTPFERISSLKASPIERNLVNINTNKRIRVDRDKNHYHIEQTHRQTNKNIQTKKAEFSNVSYVQATKMDYTPVIQFNSASIASNDSDYTTMQNNIENLKDTVLSLKEQVQRSVASREELEQKIYENKLDNIDTMAIMRVQYDEKLQIIEDKLDNNESSTQEMLEMMKSLSVDIKHKVKKGMNNDTVIANGIVPSNGILQQSSKESRNHDNTSLGKKRSSVRTQREKR